MEEGKDEGDMKDGKKEKGKNKGQMIEEKKDTVEKTEGDMD
jgi:hypothetical protein